MLNSEKPLILVADDDPLLPSIITSFLQEQYRLEIVTNGQDCLQAFNKNTPDLVLLDAVMPHPDGFECCHQIRSLPYGKDIPILIITHLDDAESIDRAFAVGANDFIPKPIHWVVLQHRIRQLLTSHALHKHNLLLISSLNYEVKVHNYALAEALKFESLLRVITDKVRNSLREEDILVTAIQELTYGLNLGFCALGIPNLEEYTCQLAYEQLGTFEPDFKTIFHLDQQIFPQLLLGCSVLYSQSLSPCSRVTIVCCPLIDGNQPLGCLNLVRSAEKIFTSLEIRLVEQVAIQCVIGIRQSRFYKALEQQLTRLSEMNQIKDEFVHLVSHELRTPLTNMKMALKMLDLLPQTEKNLHYLKILKSEWQRELDLVNDLLDLQELDSGNRDLNLESVVITRWLQDFLSPFQMRFQERNQVFTLCFQPDHLFSILTDTKLLNRIVAELLNNACKYTPAGERVLLTISATRSHIYFVVSNTGVEIPEDKLPCIFDKFTRIKHLDHDNQGGTGLGLPLLKKAIEKLQGKISVASQNKITSFEVELPYLSAV